MKFIIHPVQKPDAKLDTNSYVTFENRSSEIVIHATNNQNLLKHNQ